MKIFYLHLHVIYLPKYPLCDVLQKAHFYGSTYGQYRQQWGNRTNGYPQDQGADYPELGESSCNNSAVYISTFTQSGPLSCAESFLRLTGTSIIGHGQWHRLVNGWTTWQRKRQ